MVFKLHAVIVLITCIATLEAHSQQAFHPHYNQAEKYGGRQVKTEAAWDETLGFQTFREKSTVISDTCELNKTVFGWHPYWMGTAYEDYNYGLLSDIAYFSYEVNPITGSYNDIHFWKTTNLIDLAHDAGTRVSLTVTLFRDHDVFLNNPLARQTLADSLVSLLHFRNAKGVNIDFEAMSSTLKEKFTGFIVELSGKLRDQIPDVYISVALPAVDWTGFFEDASLQETVDLFIIMGYDYYWSSSPIAGPVAPKNSGRIWGPLNVTQSVLNYLDSGIPSSKLCLGVPYYGYEWKVLNKGPGAGTISRGDAVIFTQAQNDADLYGTIWDNHASVPYMEYQDEGIVSQVWYDDEISLGLKYDLVAMFDLAGIGIWALGYDRNTNGLWNLLKNKFTSCSNITDGNFSDLGGPEGDYHPGISYRYNLPSNNHSGIQLLFRNIDLTFGDTIKIFSGDSLVCFLTEKSPPTKKVQENIPIHLEFVAGSHESAGGWDMNWFSFGRDSLLYSLSATTIYENMPKQSEVAAVIPNDSFMVRSHFELVPGNGIYDNDHFNGEENLLFTSTSFNFEEKSAYIIRTRLKHPEGTSAYRNFLIKVKDVNDPPVLLQDAHMVVSLQANDLFNFCVSDAFYDEDEGDTLTFDLYLENGEMLPDWLNYDTGEVCFSGTPPDNVNLELIVEAQDKAGESISTTIILQNDDQTQAHCIQKGEIDVYPNPFGDKLIIDLSESGIIDPVMVKIFDQTGRMVTTRYLADIFDDIEINTTNYDNGFYILVLKSLDENKTYSLKIIQIN